MNASSEPAPFVQVFSPTGDPIVGTLERVFGVAYCNFEAAETGFTATYVGETKLHWDGQQSVTKIGQLVFVDENGNEWLERELIISPPARPSND